MTLRSTVLGVGFTALAVALTLVPARAQSDPAGLTALTVHINRTPKQSWPGYGIYLGNGLVLTAAQACEEPTEHCEKHKKFCTTHEKLRTKCPCTCAPDINLLECCAQQSFEFKECLTFCTYDTSIKQQRKVSFFSSLNSSVGLNKTTQDLFHCIRLRLPL